MTLPRLYAIADSAMFDGTDALCFFAQEIVAAGVTLIQYRNKSGNARQMLEQAIALRQNLPSHVQLIMNDRADLCLAAGFNGVHVGQDDLSPEGARLVIGKERWLGVSTHNPEQVSEADATDADYIAIGPVFSTASKVNPDPVVGIEGVKRARELTRKPLVAIGGITLENCRSVSEAGADSVAVISALRASSRQSPGESARQSVEDFFRILR